MTFKLARLRMAVAYERALERLRRAASSQQKYTGRTCPVCTRDVGVIDTAEPAGMTISCPACGHRWQADKPGPKRH